MIELSGGAYYPQGDFAKITVQNQKSVHFDLYPTSYLRIGDRVTVAPGSPNNVRIQPDSKSSIIGIFNPGEPIWLLDGPIQGDRIYWLGLSEKTGLIGWTAEGDQNETWLIPIR